MKTNKIDHIEFDSINVSSLKSVVNIFQNKKNNSKAIEDGGQESIQLSNHFGLPLSVASSEDRVIGYAFVSINKFGTTEINSYWEKEFYSIEVEQNLKFHAESIFNSMFKDPSTRTVKIQYAAEKLTNWLNLCS